MGRSHNPATLLTSQSVTLSTIGSTGALTAEGTREINLSSVPTNTAAIEVGTAAGRAPILYPGEQLILDLADPQIISLRATAGTQFLRVFYSY